MKETHLAFSMKRSEIRDGIFIPKYYDPDLDEAAELALDEYDLVPLEDLLLPGREGSHLGDWIRREWYGTGTIPFVRTSDFSNWRIRPDYKKGVNESVYLQLQQRQDVKPNDILMVAHGTYLVGNVAIVTEDDAKLVLQDHVFRLRLNPKKKVTPNYLLAAMTTGFVRRQVRARQFSADIIDKIGERHLSILVPIAKSKAKRNQVEEIVAAILSDQSDVRTRVAAATTVDLTMSRERAVARHGFSVTRRDIHNRILIPKYYDPVLEEDLAQAQENDEPWVTLDSLVSDKLVSIGTGVEVGKMAYGTGDVPFVRTSDIADLEIKRDTRHTVSEDIYKEYEKKASLEAKDILLVRDGTYLVGSSALATEDDIPALICGGIFRLRVLKKELNPYSLLTALNYPLVRRQMRAKQFTRDVIDTLGNRVLEVLLPPVTSKSWTKRGTVMDTIFTTKSRIKSKISEVIELIEPSAPPVLAGRPSWSMR